MQLGLERSSSVMFSATQYVPELSAYADEIPPIDALFMKRKQQFLDADIKDRELETIRDCISSKEDEITMLKNILIDTDEAEASYADELQRSQKLRQQTQELAVEISQACKRIVEAEQQLAALRSTPDSGVEKKQKALAWLDDNIQFTVGLSGANVEAIGKDKLTISLVPRSVKGLNEEPRYKLTVRFNPRTLDTEAVELRPADVPVADLLFVSPNLRSMHYLISELQNRLHGHLRLQTELVKLSQHFGIAKVGEREFEVTFSTGTTCHLHIGGDYPRPHASIHITHIQGHLPSGLANRLKDEKNRRVRGVTIKKLLKTVEQGLLADA